MELIQQFQHRINQAVSELDIGHKQPAELYEPIAYTMGQPGKRLRPLLSLLACHLFGGDIEKAIYPALSVEIFHNFTLVHDDIMDKAPLRRGQQTVYQKWNADIAILAGDTMFAMAYQYALKTDPALVPKVLTVFSKAAIEVCEGQQLDMNFETMKTVSIPEYLNMIRLKTAVLLGASLEIGAICAHALPEDIVHIYQFGILLGIAFQLKDDLLDVYGDQDQFGKLSGGDIATNKKTYLYLKALELADDVKFNRLTSLYSPNSILPVEDKIRQVKQILDELDVKEQVGLIMDDYYFQAMLALSNISIGSSRLEPLQDFAQKLFNRTY